MVVYSFDYETGAYLGPKQLTASDCDPRAPGTILIPGNATIEPPPRCSRGLWPFWRGGRWEIFEMVERPDPPRPDPYEQFHSIE